MKLLLEHDDHSRYLSDRVAEKPQKVLITSFGIYAGITYNGQDSTTWGDKYRLATRDLMEAMRTIPEVKILIGVAEYKSCKNKNYCIDCEKQYVKNLLRLVFHTELFPEFEWRVSTDLHLKCALFYYDDIIQGVAGGRNLTDSNWADITVVLDKKHAMELSQHSLNLWDKSSKLTDAAITDIFKSQHISDKTMESIATEANR